MDNNSKKIHSNTYKLLFETPEDESKEIDSLRYTLLFKTIYKLYVLFGIL